MTNVLVAQIGARRHYAVPRAFHAHGALSRLVTDGSADLLPWRLVPTATARLLPLNLRRLLGRRVEGVPRDHISGIPSYLLAGWLGFDRQPTPTESWALRNARFGRSVARLNWKGVDTVYAFNAAALEIFLAARARGVRCVLDQTAAPWRWNTTLLRAERERWPDWEATSGEIDASGALAEREEQEWALADRVVCGSAFAAEAAIATGCAANRCFVVPYPTGGVACEVVSRREVRGSGRLRVLYVGTLQLRKGIQYLWSALQSSQLELDVRVVGPPALSDTVMRDLKSVWDIRGARPRSEMLEHYAWADVLVLPTLSEGSANVCHEAQSCGLPTITTYCAGSAVVDGRTGLIVPPADALAIVDVLSRLDSDRPRLAEMGRAAQALSHERGLADYGRDLLSVMRVGEPAS